MASQDLMSINTVAARLGLSVHQLRRWELMFGLEIKRGRGQQRQYRPEDMTILERIKELVEQGWPTSQIRPQIEAEGLITPKLIGMPTPPGNPEVVLESLIGMRTFCERRFIEISRQIDELRQLVISLSLKQELAGEADSPWQPVEPAEMVREEARPVLPPQEIAIGPEMNVAIGGQAPVQSGTPPLVDFAAAPLPPPTQQEEALSLGEITDQNYLTVLGRALDLIGWTDEEADEYSEKTFSVPHWDELGRSQAERLVAHLVSLINQDKSGGLSPVTFGTASMAASTAATTIPTELPINTPVENSSQDSEEDDEYYEDEGSEGASSSQPNDYGSAGGGTVQTGQLPDQNSTQDIQFPGTPPFEPPA